MDREIYHGPRPEKEIRALHDENTIRVYQAFGEDIAHPALEKQTFVAPFKFEVSWASWVKPSFLWCMARTDWGRYCRIGKKGRPENEGQTVILGIDINRRFFDKVLGVAVDTHLFERIPKHLRADVKKQTKAYVQWDPEKDLHGKRRPWRPFK